MFGLRCEGSSGVRGPLERRREDLDVRAPVRAVTWLPHGTLKAVLICGVPADVLSP